MQSTRAILSLLLIGSGLAITAWHSDPQLDAESAIQWSHDLASARQRSRDSGKPILLLCDSSAGRCALDWCFTHPIIADATADLFVPLVLPAENPAEPVIRVLDADARDWVPGLAGEITPELLVARLAAGLKAAHCDVPAYMQLVDGEYNPVDLHSATFAVGCYWEGEQQLGKLPGVVSTRTGILDDDEVVEVNFDASRISSGALLNQAKSLRCFHSVQTERSGVLQPAGDQQHALGEYPEYRYLPLTLLQAIRVNAALAGGIDPGAFLSPSQRVLHDALHDIVSRLGGDALNNLQIDRSPEGLGKYAQMLRHTIAQLSISPMRAGER